MSPGLMRMWISFTAMGFMSVSVLLIYFSRYKTKQGIFKAIIAFIAYILLILSGIIIFFIVYSGPTNE